MSFQVGDKVIYPNHGLGVVQGIETKTILGTTCGFYHLRMVANETTVLVPVNTRLRTDDVAYIVEQSDTSTLILADRSGAAPFLRPGWFARPVTPPTHGSSTTSATRRPAPRP